MRSCVAMTTASAKRARPASLSVRGHVLRRDAVPGGTPGAAHFMGFRYPHHQRAIRWRRTHRAYPAPRSPAPMIYPQRPVPYQ